MSTVLILSILSILNVSLLHYWLLNLLVSVPAFSISAFLWEVSVECNRLCLSVSLFAWCCTFVKFRKVVFQSV